MLTYDKDIPVGIALLLGDNLAESVDLLSSVRPLDVDSELSTELGFVADLHRKVFRSF